ncbi:MAG: phenylacetate--CoA ligase [Ruminococcus sp.]|nr:phenylacetate--CoA ligase [Ruminococcus sp.]
MAFWEEKYECMSHDEMRSLQNERLVNVVKRVYDKVPHYKNKMDELGVKPEDIKSASDLYKLPFNTKQDLRDTYPYGMFAVPTDDVVRLHASSGTTGKQVVAGYTRKDLDIWSNSCARALTAIGATKSDFMHVSYGYGLFTGGFGAHGGADLIGMTVIPVSTGNTKRQVNILKDFGSTYICCTPSYALFIAETMAEMGVAKDDITLKGGLFGAEPWTEEMRADIEAKLCPAYDIYGLTEIIGPGVSFECLEQSGMHINEDHFLVETINPDTGEVLPEGSQGELVFTCLTKEAFPLLRYRTRDIGVLKREKCSCGRTLVKMLKPRGRSDDMLIIRGVNVFPSQIESVLMSFGQTSPNYLITVDRVNNTDKIDVDVEINPDMFSDVVSNLEKYERDIKAAIDSTLGISATVHLVEPHIIKRSEGKAVRVIDKRKVY